MPLSQLEHANENRQLVGPAPVSYLHMMQSRGETGSEHQLTPSRSEKQSAVPTMRTSETSDRKPFVIDVPGGPHSGFTGHLSDPLLMAEVAKRSGGALSGNSPSEGNLRNNTQGAKCKARRQKKAAKAAKALEKHKDLVQYESEQHDSDGSWDKA